MEKEDNENYNILGANIILGGINRTIGVISTLQQYRHSNFCMKQTLEGGFVKREDYLDNLNKMQLGLAELYGANNRMTKTLDHQDDRLTEYSETISDRERTIIQYQNKELAFERQLSEQSKKINNAAPVYNKLKGTQHSTLIVAGIFFWSTVGLSIYILTT